MPNKRGCSVRKNKIYNTIIIQNKKIIFLQASFAQSKENFIKQEIAKKIIIYYKK
jgi:hypothetical protein